jgi:DNA modification methylase
MTVTTHHGDCLNIMRQLPDNSVDSIVTDPPYGLGFMGKAWDDLLPGLPWAVECLRVLKPGGHLLAFGGTRTWHRLAVAVEDAGFEIRDSIAWLYGSGFPKSLDVSKAIDKRRDDRADVLRVTTAIRDLRDESGKGNRDLDDLFGFAGMAGHWTSTASQPAVPTVEQWTTLRDVLNPPAWLDAEVWRLNGRKGTPGEAWANADVVRTEDRMNEASGVVNVGQGERTSVTRLIKAPATDAAQQWAGWGTALKPAFEPVVVARKPLTGTVAANVQAWGTGALNIDGCRVGAGQDYYDKTASVVGLSSGHGYSDLGGMPRTDSGHRAGRWPANVVLDGTQADALDQMSGITRSNDPGTTHVKAEGWGHAAERRNTGYAGDMGGASRFFPVFADTRDAENLRHLCEDVASGEGPNVRDVDEWLSVHPILPTFKYQAKAPSSERPKVDGTAHPTVKPLALMRWLVRLVTPPGGTVLEPFAGSGTTVEACILEHFHCIAIEREADYLPLINTRIERANAQLAAEAARPPQPLDLFTDLEDVS